MRRSKGEGGGDESGVRRGRMGFFGGKTKQRLGDEDDPDDAGDDWVSNEGGGGNGGGGE